MRAFGLFFWPIFITVAVSCLLSGQDIYNSCQESPSVSEILTKRLLSVIPTRTGFASGEEESKEILYEMRKSRNLERGDFIARIKRG